MPTRPFPDESYAGFRRISDLIEQLVGPSFNDAAGELSLTGDTLRRYCERGIPHTRVSDGFTLFLNQRDGSSATALAPAGHIKRKPSFQSQPRCGETEKLGKISCGL